MCKDIMDFSQGKASQRSAGIMEFQVSVDQYEPHVFYFWERYEGNASLGRHNTSPEIRAFMENVRWPVLAGCAASLPLHVSQQYMLHGIGSMGRRTFRLWAFRHHARYMLPAEHLEQRSARNNAWDSANGAGASAQHCQPSRACHAAALLCGFETSA